MPSALPARGIVLWLIRMVRDSTSQRPLLTTIRRRSARPVHGDTKNSNAFSGQSRRRGPPNLNGPEWQKQNMPSQPGLPTMRTRRSAQMIHSDVEQYVREHQERVRRLANLQPFGMERVANLETLQAIIAEMG